MARDGTCRSGLHNPSPTGKETFRGLLSQADSLEANEDQELRYRRTDSTLIYPTNQPRLDKANSP